MTSLKLDIKTLRSDVVSGFATGLFSIPEGMAYAKLAGVNPVYGLYSGMISTIVASLTTRSILMISTLTSAIALSTASVIQVSGIQPSQMPQALFTITLLVGAVMFVMGLLRLGSVVNFVSNAVMTGFVAGASLLIIIGELGDFSGYDPSGANKLMKVVDWFANIGQWDPATTAVGLSTVILMIILKRIERLEKLAPIITLFLMTVGVKLLNISSVALVSSVAKIPNSLPTPMLPSVELIPKLALGSVSVALVALVQGAGIGTAYPNPDGSRPNASRDFIGQGLGNLIGSVFQSMGTGGSLSRTGISVGAGASSRWGGILAGFWLGLIVLLFGQLAELVPLSVIAGMLFVIGAELIAGRLPDARLVLASSRGSVAAGMVTFLSALFIPLQWTIFLGAGLSMVLYIYASATHVHLLHLVRRPDGKFETGDVPEVFPSNQPTAVFFEGNKFFAEVPLFDELLPSRQDVKNAVVILCLRHQDSVSSTALKWLQRYTTELQRSGNLLMLAGVEPHVMQALDRAGLRDHIGKENVFEARPILEASLSEALDAAEVWLQNRKKELEET
ncbi:Sulfate permease [Olavius algarvensis Delta 1 endosymbiont]|nr:Sulfate permease [Olavius algarvensis Delta 1 endosymbiont]